jgi:hypothetical protein
MARKPKATTPAQDEISTPSPGRTRTRNAPQPEVSMNGCVGEDAIRDLAYRKWEEAGCPTGDGMAFWLAAERELRSR